MAIAATKMSPLKSSDRISVSRSRDGYISQLLSREKRLLSTVIFSTASISSGDRPLYTMEARERMSDGSSVSSLMMRVTFLCSEISRGDTGLKTPSSNMASTVLVMVYSPVLETTLILTKKFSQRQYRFYINLMNLINFGEGEYE